MDLSVQALLERLGARQEEEEPPDTYQEELSHPTQDFERRTRQIKGGNQEKPSPWSHANAATVSFYSPAKTGNWQHASDRHVRDLGTLSPSYSSPLRARNQVLSPYKSPHFSSSSPTARVAARRDNQTRLSQAATPIRNYEEPPPFESFSTVSAQSRPPSRTFDAAPQPLVQGISLVSVHELPDRQRSIFPFRVFNAVQSKSFLSVYGSNDNVVLSAPTGSGKTAVLELAICRLAGNHTNDDYKVIYMAPTKSLCSERFADWSVKFASLGMQCAELTGDTDISHMKHLQTASIIITTPEKWDSMTRRWSDHRKLMQLVRLVLIDEVHILKDIRGATLEAVVSRMKSSGTSVRFVALSATVPNSDDIATWLGKDSSNPGKPAQREAFGEEFRPVILKRHVCGISFGGNDFAFEGVCNSKLPELIASHSEKKPIMVFCGTRRSTMLTAKSLADLWKSQNARDKHWSPPSFLPSVQDNDLQGYIAAGVAFHHAGLTVGDRAIIEDGFRKGQIGVICCTSTLAVGVNLPCHLVIIKNTVSWQDDGMKEYSDLEMMQMLGRAGRPQFDKSATAIIITRSDKAERYERLVAGEQILESSLHLNLVDHINAEIGLGSIRDLASAKRWLHGTFLAVRMAANPTCYQLEGDTGDRNLDQRIEQICQRDIDLLQETKLVSEGVTLKGTAFGEIMSRYYVKFASMKSILELPSNCGVNDILDCLCKAEEFKEIYFRPAERSLFKTINESNGIKFKIEGEISSASQKLSLIIQSELGGVEFPEDDQYGRSRRQFMQDKSMVFSNINRLARCVVDCQAHLNDGFGARNATELARGLAARVWDDSSLTMRQLPNIGPVAVRRLVAGGVNSLEALEAEEPARVNMLLSKQFGFAEKLQFHLRSFPKLYLNVEKVSQSIKAGKDPVVKLQIDLGFLNDKTPLFWNRKPVYLCLLVVRSDGQLILFKRLQAKDVEKVVNCAATFTSPSQDLFCSVSCEELAGTDRRVEFKPELPISCFRPQSALSEARSTLGTSTRPANAKQQTASRELLQDFDNDLDDDELNAIAEFVDLDVIEVSLTSQSKSSAKDKNQSSKQVVEPSTPVMREDGKYDCNHKCKDKTVCKHLCCREGLDKPPKATKKANANEKSEAESSGAARAKTKDQDITKLLAGKQTNKAPSKPIPSKPTTIMDTQLSSSPIAPGRVSRLPLTTNQHSRSNYNRLPSTDKASHGNKISSELDLFSDLPDLDMLLPTPPNTSSLKRKRSSPVDTSKTPQKQARKDMNNIDAELEDDSWLYDLPDSDDVMTPFVREMDQTSAPKHDPAAPAASKTKAENKTVKARDMSWLADVEIDRDLARRLEAFVELIDDGFACPEDIWT